MKEASSKKDFDIIAPKGFMASAQNENVLAGMVCNCNRVKKVHWVVVWDSVCQRVAKVSPALPLK